MNLGPGPRSDAEQAQSGLLQATLAGLERLAQLNTEAMHRDPYKYTSMADLMRELGLLARMHSARSDLVLQTLRDRLRLEPLPAHVRPIGLEVSGNGSMNLGSPLAHFVIVDMLCQQVARWPASEHPLIKLSAQNGQACYTCMLKALDGDEQQRLNLALHTLDLTLMPFKRDLRAAPATEPGGHLELTILIGA
jgi:hypothetical protein